MNRTTDEDKRDAEVAKLRAEEQKLIADAAKAKGDSHLISRLIPSLSVLATIVIAALTLYVTRKRDISEELARSEEAAARRWRTFQGSFEITHEDWFSPSPQMPAVGSGLAGCDLAAKLAHARTCSEHRGLLCSANETSPDGQTTSFRVYRCWVQLPDGLRLTEARSRTYTASLTGFDFDISPDANQRSRNPRIQVYVQDASDDGFEVVSQTWDNSVPWLIGIAWSATGRVQ